MVQANRTRMNFVEKFEELIDSYNAGSRNTSCFASCCRSAERSPTKSIATLRTVLALDWRKRQSSRPRVEEEIGEVLDEELPRAYSPEIYHQKCGVVFQHVFEKFPVGPGV